MTATLTGRHSGVAGINWRTDRGMWEVSKCFMGSRYFLGRHETLGDAKAAMAAWTPTAEDLAEAADRSSNKQQLYAPQPLHADGFPTLGRTRLTDEQIAYALSIAHELRGF